MQAMMWPMLKVLGMSCQSTFELCSEQMDRKLTPGEKVRLRIHLMMCGVCRRLPAQFSRLRQLVRSACEHEHGHEESPDAKLSPEAKAQIIEILQQESQSKPSNNQP